MVSSLTTTLSAALETEHITRFDKEVLLKRMTRKLSTLAPLRVLQQTAQTVDEVVLEFDIDDVPYYVVRCRPRAETKKNKISLSPRERAIARLVAQGLPNKSIGKTLGITHWTVATHLRRVFLKLGVTSRAAMIKRLVEENQL